MELEEDTTWIMADSSSGGKTPAVPPGSVLSGYGISRNDVANRTSAGVR
jgi:hypothetical protein